MIPKQKGGPGALDPKYMGRRGIYIYIYDLSEGDGDADGADFTAAAAKLKTLDSVIVFDSTLTRLIA